MCIITSLCAFSLPKSALFWSQPGWAWKWGPQPSAKSLAGGLRWFFTQGTSLKKPAEATWSLHSCLRASAGVPGAAGAADLLLKRYGGFNAAPVGSVALLSGCLAGGITSKVALKRAGALELRLPGFAVTHAALKVMDARLFV